MIKLARGWKDDPDTAPWLKTRAQADDNELDRIVAVQELARGWEYKLRKIPWLKNRAQADDRELDRIVAIQKLARGWKHENWIFEFLYDRAINDPFVQDFDYRKNPRYTALNEIVKNFLEHPKTLDLLNDRAANDSDRLVREFAEKVLKITNPSNHPTIS